MRKINVLRRPRWARAVPWASPPAAARRRRRQRDHRERCQRRRGLHRRVQRRLHQGRQPLRRQGRHAQVRADGRARLGGPGQHLLRLQLELHASVRPPADDLQAAAPGDAGLKLVPDLAEGARRGQRRRQDLDVQAQEGHQVRRRHARSRPRTSSTPSPAATSPTSSPTARSTSHQYLDADGYKGPYKDKNLDDFKGDRDAGRLHRSSSSSSSRSPSSTSSSPTRRPRRCRRPRTPASNTRSTVASTGPYKFESYEVGKQLNLVKNTNWDPATDTTRKQLPDRIEVQYKSERRRHRQPPARRADPGRPGRHRRAGRGSREDRSVTPS